MHSRIARHVINFSDGSVPIQVDYPDPRVFRNCSNYADRVPGLSWNKFSIHHLGQLEYLENPQQVIVEAIFDAVDGEEFYPVAYERGPHADNFLARACKPAIDKLFAQKLCLSISTGASLQISVQFGVAANRSNQISPPLLVSQEVSRLMERLEVHNGVRGVLNLSNFGANPCFKNIVVSLANVSTLRQVCQNIYHDDRFSAVNGFIFADNQMKSVDPLKLFGDVEYGLLDLSGNKIGSSVRLCRELNRVRAKELKLADNPITKSSKYPNSIKALQGNFSMVDGIPYDKLHSTYTPLNHDIDMESDGIRIDWTNKWKLADFEHSEDWHAFLVPDPMHLLTEQQLFSLFFITANQMLTEIYPCYYKFDGKEHIFMVRNCFEQIAYLVHSCNLEIKLPEMQPKLDDPDVSMDPRTIPFYLRMNVIRFQLHHVDPQERITKCIQKCYVVQNRLLKLSDFQATEGLKGLWVHMGSTRILNNMLTIISRLFMSNCSEIRLCNNNILRIDDARVLTRMGNLRALDLGHNWIHDLEHIKALGELPLKSLRLHGNPLCQKYSLPNDYIQAVLEIFPQLTTLDGVDLSSKPGQAPQKNFLCDIGAYELVGDVFLHNYLREFEQADERANLLMKYYTDDSIFTMTCSYVIERAPSFNTHINKRISKYNRHSRNIKKWSDYSKATNEFHVGVTEIIDVLMELPSVVHDFISLQTDVMHFNGQSAVIHVTGLMRDDSPSTHNQKELYLAFSRNFVLKVDDQGLGFGKKSCRLKIVNDHLSIMNPSRNQLKSAFKVCPLPKDRVMAPASEDSLEGKSDKLIFFLELTGLTSPWCTRIVESAEWDFELATKMFLKMVKNSEIPESAFL